MEVGIGGHGGLIANVHQIKADLLDVAYESLLVDVRHSKVP